MGWGFRKSVNFGGFRVNLSKSGVGYSFGGKGFRVGRDARGRNYTSTSIPGTGFYNRTYSSSNSTEIPVSEHPSVHLEIPASEGFGFIKSEYARFAMRGYFNFGFILTLAVGTVGLLYHSRFTPPDIQIPCAIAALLVVGQIIGGLFAMAMRFAFIGPELEAVDIIQKLQNDKQERQHDDALKLKDELFALRKSGKTKEAIERIKNLPRDGAGVDEFIFDLVDICVEDKSGVEIGLELLTKAPDTEKKTLCACLLYSQKGDLEYCQKILNIHLQSRTREALQVKHVYEYIYALCLLNCGYTDQALQYFKSAESRHPGYLEGSKYIERLGRKRRQRKTHGAQSVQNEYGDPYEILGVVPESSKEVITRAYHQKIAQYHPDKVATMAAEFQRLAEEKTRELNWAYEECLRKVAG